ncbi:myosin X [Salpingoeca rosetta]|uniref:Myosin X n=1 Tax=Salpingoeca rosetta (strain ATCC 50818 / BSB-021) TaxID=946362 RepID=F2UJR5_SALR5|nr:myosin X [Salpingoeca rosetta]EGD77364.1 myosin X [Salpingoeca rosetta]|eukprot:XP_004990708.1 myosin X [Salpingoeca rosetta]
MDDLAQLRELSESALVKQLSSRFSKDVIYTYIGDILVACNPYRELGLYTQAMQDKYKGRVPRTAVAPHVYFVANYAYERMMQTKTDQSFVISGESGAGKTETTKHIITHVMEVCKAGKTILETNILRLNPLLEAFGNAQTVMNDNSSRFGKYINLNFDRTGSVLGAELTTYLLEKSRVTHLQDNESNFHIFYYVLEGMSEENRSQRHLKPVSQHAYVRNTSKSAHNKKRNMEQHFNQLLDMMFNFGFDATEIDALFDVISAILHIGDIAFTPAPNDGASVSSSSSPSLQHAAELTGLDEQQLQSILTTAVTTTRGEHIVRLHDPTAAADARDSIAKSLYSRCFAWLISSLNDTLACDASVSHLKACSMGVLDIFGFEQFEENSLEQLCINITNEHLQRFFNQHIFEMEVEAYKQEGIDGSEFSYPDNQDIIFLCAGKGGILSLLNEKSRFPQGSDNAFVNKCGEQLKQHRSNAFTPARSSRDLKFTVNHFAGQVTYSCEGFLEKNKDKLADSVVPTLLQSRSEFLVALYTAQRDMASGFKVQSKRRQSKQSANLATLSSFFLKSLDELMSALNRTMPHFVRCIKPNTDKKPHAFNSKAVSKQLKYAGVLETVRIRQAGYAVRMSFEEFCKHYRIIFCKAHEQPNTDAETAQRILTLAGLKNYRIGTSKVFLKYNHIDELQLAMRKHAEALRFVRKVCKGFIARVRYRAILAAKRETLDAVAALLTACEVHRDAIGEFRKKRRVLDVLLEETMDDDERQGVLDRIAAMDTAIDTELEKLNDVLKTNDELRMEIKKLKTQFDRQEHEAAHGMGTYDEDDVEDLYAVERSVEDTIPRKLDPEIKKRLSVHALKQADAPKEYTDTMRKGFFGTLFGRRKKHKSHKKKKSS